VKPVNQYGIESRLPAFFKLADLPGETTEQSTPAEWLPKLISHQHPDQDCGKKQQRMPTRDQRPPATRDQAAAGRAAAHPRLANPATRMPVRFDGRLKG
jgi:hypothetical protein